MPVEYFDCNGTQIKEGDKLRHKPTGEIDVVLACGDGDLGFNASNPDYLARHPDAYPECYPLSDFDLRDWEVVK